MRKNNQINEMVKRSFQALTGTIIKAVGNMGIHLGEFGTSLDDIVLALNNTAKVRQSDRQKVYTFL